MNFGIVARGLARRTALTRSLRSSLLQPTNFAASFELASSLEWRRPEQAVWTRGKKKKAKKGDDEPSVNNNKGGADAAVPTVDLKKTQEKINRVTEGFKHELAKLRTGRPDPSMLDQIKVEAYGQPTPLPNVAQVSLKSPKLLTVNVFDSSLLDLVRAAIQQSNMNLNPSVEGSTINVPIPKMTKETRNEMAKKARDAREKTKVSINTIRRDVMKDFADMKKSKVVSEDEIFAQQKESEKIFEDAQNKVAKMCDEREKEIMAQ